MARKALVFVLLLVALVPASTTASPTPDNTIETVALPSASSPIIVIRLMFKVGSMHDPAGKEGLAALTGMMLAEAGTEKRSYSELIDRLYPMAASIDVDTDREVTVISGRVHREKLADFVALLTEVVLEPGFTASDFERNREQLSSYLTTTLRATNDELLGLEALQQVIFQNHPYQHSPAGTVEALAATTLDDVRKFYRQRFTRANLTLGVAGGYPDGFVTSLEKRLAALPAGEQAGRPQLPEPRPVEGRRFTLIDKETDSVGIHFGFPLSINRADPDYYALMVANSYLGEHRTFHGRLMQQLRGKRGLNYGDYSYIEYWHLPPFTSNPSPGYPRRQQYFSVWVRPVVPATAHFALRNALFEVDRLIERGLTAGEFELAREFLVNYSKLWAQTLSDRLGFLMDSRYLGMPYYIDEIDSRLASLTVEEVNQAVKKYLQTADLHVVLVTKDAARVQAYLEKEEPSPMQYNSEPESQILEDDKRIQQLSVEPASFRIVPVSAMFQK